MKISKKILKEIILQEFNKIIRESEHSLEDFDELPESEAVEKIRSMDPDKVTASTIRIFMTHKSKTVQDYVKQKFKTLKIEDPPELLGIKIFLAFPKEGEDAPLWDLAKELELDIKELPSEQEIESFQKELNSQEEEYHDDLPTAFCGGCTGDPLMIKRIENGHIKFPYYLSPSSGSYIDVLVETYKKLLDLYKYPYEPIDKVEAVRKGIEKILGGGRGERTSME